MEGAFGLATALLVWRFGSSGMLVYYWLFFMALLLIAWVDWETSYIYDVVTYPLLALGLGASVFWPENYSAWWSSLAGAALMLLLLEGSYQLVRWISGRDALGGGDVKLMAAAGAFLGPWASMRALVLVALISPLYWLAVMRIKNLDTRDAFPYGPVLAAGAAISAWELLSLDIAHWAHQNNLRGLAELLLF